MSLTYSSGEEIRKGDRVTPLGFSAVIELVADPEECPQDWYVEKYGGGC